MYVCIVCKSHIVRYTIFMLIHYKHNMQLYYGYNWNENKLWRARLLLPKLGISQVTQLFLEIKTCSLNNVCISRLSFWSCGFTCTNFSINHFFSYNFLSSVFKFKVISKCSIFCLVFTYVNHAQTTEIAYINLFGLKRNDYTSLPTVTVMAA